MHTIFMDGRVLFGRVWVRPEDWEEADIEAGRLVALKGCTPTTLPSLGDDQQDDQGGQQHGEG